MPTLPTPAQIEAGIRASRAHHRGVPTEDRIGDETNLITKIIAAALSVPAASTDADLRSLLVNVLNESENWVYTGAHTVFDVDRGADAIMAVFPLNAASAADPVADLIAEAAGTPIVSADEVFPRSAPVDHRTAALRLIESVTDKPSANVEYQTGQRKADTLAEAQVHATLALAEQQRIANLISLMQMQSESDETTEHLAGEAMHALIENDRTPATPFSDPDDVPVIRPEVAKALGL